MTHTSTGQKREKCAVCNGSGTGENGFDCLRCDGDGWVFAEPAQPAAAHTSTEQPEALKGIQTIIRRLHARVLELEASQAQRVPLSAEDVRAMADVAGYFAPFDRARFIDGIRHAEAAHGITQEKQG